MKAGAGRGAIDCDERIHAVPIHVGFANTGCFRRQVAGRTDVKDP